MEERQFINRVYLKSLFPVSLAVLLIQICSVVNNIIVGKLIGSDGLAIMSVVSPIGFVFSTFGSLLAVGGSIQAAHCLGEQKKDESNRCLYIAVKLSVIIGFLFTAFIILFSNTVIKILGVPFELVDETKKYLLAFAPAAFAAMGIYIPFNYLKIHGAQKYGIYVSCIMAFVTIGLDIVFVKVLDMGVAGIGLASTIGYFAATVPGICFLYSKKGGFSRPDSKNVVKGLKNIVVSGSPSATNNLCNLLRSYFMNLLIIASIGSKGLSAFSIISTVFMFSVTISNGTSLTMVPFAAVFSSEKDNKSLRQIFAVATTSAFVLMTVFALFIEFFPREIARFFAITDKETLSLTVKALRIFALSLIVSAVNTIYSTFYQSIKHTAFSNVLTVLRSFALVILSALLITKLFAPDNIWYAFIFAEVITLLLTFIISSFISKRKKDLSKILLMDKKSENEGKYIAFSADSDNASAAESAQKIVGFCESNDLSPKLTMALGIAIEEILVLFNDHALSDGNNNRTNVRVLIHEDVVVLRFRNCGKQFDPIEYAKTSDDIMSDTMGIKMVQKLTEVVLYDRVFGINNLTIIF